MIDNAKLPPLTAEAFDAMLEQSAVIRQIRDAVSLAEANANAAVLRADEAVIGHPDSQQPHEA